MDALTLIAEQGWTVEQVQGRWTVLSGGLPLASGDTPEEAADRAWSEYGTVTP